MSTPLPSDSAAPPVLAIAGPTASGKTAAALAIARDWQARGQAVEIISVDSALVYRGMDIGTAKPTAEELATCPHHLIDTLAPEAAYSAAEFVADATRLVGEIRARGALPLLVGGTMLYFKTLFGGMDALPAADPAVRAAIDARAQALGWPALHAELAQVDPVTAARLAPRDAQRIQRALEVWQLSGQPLSSLHTGRFEREDEPAALTVAGLPCRLIALEPADRAWLHARIGQRFAAMLDSGFLDEMRTLRQRPGLHLGLPAMRCVGYRQAWELMDEHGDVLPAAARALLAERGAAATRQLAKRQLTWLRSLPQREVVACDAGDALATLRQRCGPGVAAFPERPDR